MATSNPLPEVMIKEELRKLKDPSVDLSGRDAEDYLHYMQRVEDTVE